MKNSSRVLKLFDNYRRLIKNIWEEYLLLDFSLRDLKETHKKNSIIPLFKRELLLESRKLDYKDLDIHHFIDNLVKNKLANRALIEAVSLTENYLQDLTVYVYHDYPQKLLNSSPDTPASELKLVNLIVTSDSTEPLIKK